MTAEAGQPGHLPAGAPPPATRSGLIRVVVVDDDFRVASIHASCVEQVPGFAVVAQAHSAAALFDAIARLDPDLVLLDLYLPDLNGLEVLRRLRASGSSLDVIVITAANDVASVHSAVQGGALYYLLKPFDLGLLKERLTAYKAVREQLSGGRRAGQRQVDELIGALGRGPATPEPAAQPSRTSELVERLLLESDGDFSASEVAERLGISRATAQRALTQLEASKRATMSLRYGAAGRPEHRYRSEGGHRR